MTDLGLLSYYLGIEVKQEADGITVCQSSYAAKILEEAGMSDCNSCSTPMENRLKLKKNSGQVQDSAEYRSVIGSLRYLVNTRPDIAYAVGIVSRFMESPGKEHWVALKQILRYIKGTLGYGCIFRKGEREVLVGFSDSDHAGDINDRKSTTGVVFFLGSSVGTWSSQKQKIVALSSCEAEYIAGATAATQAVWLSRLLAEMLGEDIIIFESVLSWVEWMLSTYQRVIKSQMFSPSHWAGLSSVSYEAGLGSLRCSRLGGDLSGNQLHQNVQKFS